MWLVFISWHNLMLIIQNSTSDENILWFHVPAFHTESIESGVRFPEEEPRTALSNRFCSRGIGTKL